MTETWYEDWFDTTLYEQLYANRDEKEARQLGALLERVIPLTEYPEILDMGCGRGRHALTMAEKGYQVTGIDLSPRAIEVAREKALRKGLTNVRFEVRDMRNPLAQKFNAIVNLFTTFGYFKNDQENASILDSMRTMLRPGGRLVIDYLNPDYVRNNLRPREKGTINNITYYLRRYIEDGMVFKRIEFTNGKQVDKEYTFTERVKLYSLNWFQQRLSDRGFTLQHTYGNYAGEPYDKEKSDRLIMIFDELNS